MLSFSQCTVRATELWHTQSRSCTALAIASYISGNVRLSAPGRGEGLGRRRLARIALDAVVVRVVLLGAQFFKVCEGKKFRLSVEGVWHQLEGGELEGNGLGGKENLWARSWMTWISLPLRKAQSTPGSIFSGAACVETRSELTIGFA